MPEAKTKPTDRSVQAYIAAIGDEARRRDCETLVALMHRVTKHEPRMWGPSIIGFGSYHYKYESGRKGDACLAGFAPRKGDTSVYVVAGLDEQKDLLDKLGKHKTGKACLYIKRLADVDLAVLEKIVARSVATIRKRYPE